MEQPLCGNDCRQDFVSWFLVVRSARSRVPTLSSPDGARFVKRQA
jgi:hypothetical protein